MKVSFLTTSDNKAKGIRTYSNRIMSEITSQTVSEGITFMPVYIKQIISINYNIFKNIKARMVFSRLGKEMNNADIAHIQYESSLFCLWTNPFENMYKTFRSKISIPTIITVHELEERKRSKSLIKKIIKFFYYIFLTKYLDYVNRKIFEECEAIIVHTNKSRNTLIKRSITADKIYLIPHGIPFVEKSADTAKNDRSKLNISPDKFVITTFGFISERKGQDIVINILDELPEDIIYVIAGEVLNESPFIEYYTFLQSEIKRKGLGDKVVFTGFIEDHNVKVLMNASDIIIAPSRDITASGSISDAIGYNKAIIASDIEFVNEINTIVNCIKTFKKESSTDLMNAIIDLKNNSREMERLITGTKQYQKKFSYGSAAALTIDLYKKIFYESKTHKSQ